MGFDDAVVEFNTVEQGVLDNFQVEPCGLCLGRLVVTVELPKANVIECAGYFKLPAESAFNPELAIVQESNGGHGPTQVAGASCGFDGVTIDALLEFRGVVQDQDCLVSEDVKQGSARDFHVGA